MDISKLWKSEEDIKKEQAQLEVEIREQEIRKARENNLVQDTEVLAEMVMTSMMESMALAEEIETLKSEIREMKDGIQKS